MIRYNPDLVYQVVRAKLLNKRRPMASTKDRSEVSGGGRKPWPQKGTGRARHGSIRSPLWRGGGITFGPRPERTYSKVVPKKMVRKAFCMVLEKKKGDKEVVPVDQIELAKSKTKLLAQWLGGIIKGGSILVVPHTNIEIVKRAGKNIPHVKVVESENVDIIDLLSYKYLIITNEALARLEERAKTYNT